jgi:hypothetical protein
MLDSLSGLYGDSLAIISYNHTFGDTAAIRPRDSLYSTPIYPTAFFDGTDEVFEPDPGALFTTYYDHYIAAKSDTPNYNLYLTATATASAGDLQLRIVTADTIPSGEMLAYVAICQDSIRGFSKDFNYVCMQMYRFPVDLVYPDSLDTTITFGHTLPVDKMRAVVFVQNMNTKKVMHSITKRFEEVE